MLNVPFYMLILPHNCTSALPCIGVAVLFFKAGNRRSEGQEKKRDTFTTMNPNYATRDNQVSLDIFDRPAQVEMVHLRFPKEPSSSDQHEYSKPCGLYENVYHIPNGHPRISTTNVCTTASSIFSNGSHALKYESEYEVIDVGPPGMVNSTADSQSNDDNTLYDLASETSQIANDCHPNLYDLASTIDDVEDTNA